MMSQGPMGESSAAEASFLLVSQALPRDERGICQGSQATKSNTGRSHSASAGHTHPGRLGLQVTRRGGSLRRGGVRAWNLPSYGPGTLVSQSSQLSQWISRGLGSKGGESENHQIIFT